MTPPLDEASLLACLTEARSRAAASRRPVLASWSQRCGDVDPVSLFVANREQGHQASLWAIPQQGFSMIGIGCAREFQVEPGSCWKLLQDCWQQLARPAVIRGGHRIMLCGGFAFDPSRPAHPMWQDFPVGALTLAEFCVVSTREEVRLTVNALVAGDTNCVRLAERLAADSAAITALPEGGVRGTSDSRAWPAQDISIDSWMYKVSTAVAAIRAGDLDKVVLARSQTVPMTSELDAAIRALWSIQPDAYVFAFARGGSCFLGASPERLIDLRAGCLTTCALAGSAPRSESSSEDERLGQCLLSSVKDQHEHRLVVDDLQSVLRPVCHAVDIPSEPKLRKLKHVQHLMTPIRGALSDDAPLLAVLQRLHPTAAVGGLPRDRAMDYIRDCEGLGRGWYAGPVGWMDDRGDGEFAVALRSALLRDGQAALFAGCGIVCDSQAEAEFCESEMKMRSMASALTGC